MSEVSLGEIQQGAIREPGGDEGCPEWGCGSNSPVIEAIGFWDLHELGLANAQGFRITGFKKQVNGSWVSYRPDVINGQLVARYLRGGAIAHHGTALINSKFLLRNARTGLDYELHVMEVEHANMWVQTSAVTVQSTFTYRLGWKYPHQTIRAIDICGVPQAPETDGMKEFHAVLFDDDRVDADALAVTGESPDWFNIGCRSHALAKQHLLAQTKAGNAIVNLTTTIGQRTANLKMLAADYCGNGHPFTVPGQPLHWRDAHTGYDTLPSVNLPIEARWTATGATCLNQPRVDNYPTVLGTDVFKYGVESLLDPADGWCTSTNPRPPPCTGSMLDMQGADIISVNVSS